MKIPQIVIAVVAAVFVYGCAAPPMLPPQEHWSKGTEAFHATNYKTAIRNFEAILANPKTPAGMKPATLFLLGEAYNKVGKDEKAKELFDRLVRQYPRSSYARQVYGRM